MVAPFQFDLDLFLPFYMFSFFVDTFNSKFVNAFGVVLVGFDCCLTSLFVEFNRILIVGWKGRNEDEVVLPAALMLRTAFENT